MLNPSTLLLAFSSLAIPVLSRANAPHTTTIIVTSSGTTQTSTQFYTIISSTLTFYVGQAIPFQYLSNLSTTTYLDTTYPGGQLANAAITTVTSPVCPSSLTNNVAPLGRETGFPTACLYCPPGGPFYIDRGGECQTDTRPTVNNPLGAGLASSTSGTLASSATAASATVASPASSGIASSVAPHNSNGAVADRGTGFGAIGWSFVVMLAGFVGGLAVL